jgi:hypothetical protein
MTLARLGQYGLLLIVVGLSLYVLAPGGNVTGRKARANCWRHLLAS